MFRVYEIYEHLSLDHLVKQFYIYKVDGYLHKDGIVRKSTLHQGQYTGFFDTEDEAKAVIIKDMAKSIKRLSEEESFAVLNAIYRLNDKNIDIVQEIVSEIA